MAKYIIDADGNQVLEDQTDLNGTAPGGTADPFQGQGYQTLAEQIQLISDFAENELPTAITEMEGTLDGWLSTINDRMSQSQGNGRLVVLHTVNGVPSVFYRQPKMLCEQLDPSGELGTGVFPAFIENGEEKDALYVAAFPMTSVNGEAVSLPFAEPWTDIDRDEAITACANTQIVGHENNHRLWSVWDRAFFLHESTRRGYQPLGNTSFGVSHENAGIVGEPSSVLGRILTGSMGAESSHTGASDGVFDLVGIWAWCSGMQIDGGQISLNNDNTAPDNIAALTATNEFYNSSNPALTTGYSTPSVGSTSQSNGGSAYDYIAGSRGFAAMLGGSIKLKRAGLAPLSTSPDGALWVRAHGLRAPLVGGSWHYGSHAGLAALNLNNAPSYRYSHIGFRSAFVA